MNQPKSKCCEKCKCNFLTTVNACHNPFCSCHTPVKEVSECCGAEKISCTFIHSLPACKNRFHCVNCGKPFIPRGEKKEDEEEFGEMTFEIKKCSNCKHTDIQHLEDGACFIEKCKCKKFTSPESEIKEEDWEKEFDKKFENTSWWEQAENNKNSPVHTIKSFISTLIKEREEKAVQAERERWMKETLKLQKKETGTWLGTDEHERPTYKLGYNQALLDVISSNEDKSK